MFGEIWSKLMGSSDKLGELLTKSGLSESIKNTISSDYVKNLCLKDHVTHKQFIIIFKDINQCAAICKLFKDTVYFNDTQHESGIFKNFHTIECKSMDELLSYDNKIQLIFTNNIMIKDKYPDFKTIGFDTQSYDYTFAYNVNSNNVGLFFNNNNVIGFSINGIFNSKFNTANTLNNLFTILLEKKNLNIKKNKKSTDYNKNIENSKIGINEILHILNQMESLLTNPILSKMLGGKISPEQTKHLKQVRDFIKSLTVKERNDINLLNDHSRIERISKGLNKSIQHAEQMKTIVDTLLNKLGPLLSKMQSNPGAMMDILKNGDLTNIMKMIG